MAFYIMLWGIMGLDAAEISIHEKNNIDKIEIIWGQRNKAKSMHGCMLPI